MSDKELVTIDREQFAGLGEGFRSIAEKLAHIERTLYAGLKALAEVGDTGDNSEVLKAINNLDRKVDLMSSNIDRIEKEAADAAENVELVRTAVEDLKAASAAMQEEIASLRNQLAQGQIDQARLDAAAATFEKADDDIDQIVLPGTTAEPVEG